MNIVDARFSSGARIAARQRRSRRFGIWMVGILGLVSTISLAVPVFQYSQIDGVVAANTRRMMNSAAWQWQGLVAAGTDPIDATEQVTAALHARLVESRREAVEIPFMPESRIDALHDSFRLNPFIRSGAQRTNREGERRELVEAGRRVATLQSAILQREEQRVRAGVRRKALAGVLVTIVCVVVGFVVGRNSGLLRLTALPDSGD